jgi:hypothetical protein
MWSGAAPTISMTSTALREAIGETGLEPGARMVQASTAYVLLAGSPLAFVMRSDELQGAGTRSVR